jgi:hypothetical protein
MARAAFEGEARWCGEARDDEEKRERSAGVSVTPTFHKNKILSI